MSGYRFSKAIEVRFRDCDPYGHVNNSVYLTYLETARFAYWREVVGLPGPGEPGFILARAELDFRGQPGTGDLLEVRVRVDAIGRSSFTVGAEIVRPSDGLLVVEARTVMVVYDYETRKSVPMPQRIRDVLAEYEGRDLSRTA